MSSYNQKLEQWVDRLTMAQTRAALMGLLHVALDNDVISFDALAPYYDSTEQPLVPGQRVYAGDDEVVTVPVQQCCQCHRAMAMTPVCTHCGIIPVLGNRS